MGFGLRLISAGKTVLFKPLENAAVVIGSHGDSDLCIPDSDIPRIQCVLRVSSEQILLQNRDRAGTRVNGRLVEGECELRANDILSLGKLSAVVEQAGVRAVDGQTQTMAMVGPDATLQFSVLVEEEKQTKSYPVGNAGLSFGKDPGNDVILDDPYISRFHMRVWPQANRLVVEDVGSRNGVFLGSQKIRSIELEAGAKVRLGGVRVEVQSSADSKPTTEISSGFVGSSQAVKNVVRLIPRVAKSDVPILITGETGTGKEVIARMLYENSPRSSGPFVALNCGALSRELIESEFFGHEKGAFTGAGTQKKGVFEAADKGTVFLDEIGELPIDLQPKLLRVLENSEVKRVGAAHAKQVNVRILAATNRRLEEEVRERRFREDLWHRLNVITLELPPLRVRQNDIEELAIHFVRLYGDSTQLSLSAGAMGKLRSHHWPGNVRELRNVIQRAVLLRGDDCLSEDDIVFNTSTLEERVEIQSAVASKTLAELEKDAIAAELSRHDGNQSEAANALGISRSTIRRKMQEYKLA